MGTKRILNRRRRIVERLPPLEDVVRGTVIVRFLRCGKSTCHCADGDGHRAVYLTVTHAGGKTEQISLPASLISGVERQVANYQAWWAAIEQISAINRELIREERKKPARSKREIRPSGS